METATLKVEFRESRVGNEMLVINGCKYMVNRRSGDTVYWRCIYSWCHSRAVIKSGQLKSARGTHICPQPQQSETTNSSVKSNSAEVSTDSQVVTTPNISIQSVFSMNNSQWDYQNPECEPPLQQELIGNKEVFEIKGLEDAASNLDDNASTEYSFSTANSSFLEFVEDKSVLSKAEASDEKISIADSAWKKRILASLKVYSETEQLRRFKIAYTNRKNWCDNRKHFSEKLSGSQKKWRTSNAVWTYSKDWPTRSHCMKLTKPERGVGFFVDQPLVPIKIIDEVRPIPNFVMTSKETKRSILGIHGNESDVNKEEIMRKQKVGKTDIMDDGVESSSEMSQVNEKMSKPFRNEGKCPICDKVFQSSLERHLNVHYGIKPFTCEYCEKSFSQEHSYRSHVRIHTEDRPFCCTICPKKFTSNGTLKRHIISHSSGKTFCCNSCGKRFRKAQFLQHHSFKCHDDGQIGVATPSPSSKVEIIGNDGESLTKVTSPVKKKRKVSRKLNEDDEEHDKPYLSKKLGFIDRELRKRKQQLLLDDSDSNLEAESSRSASRQFTLDELK